MTYMNLHGVVKCGNECRVGDEDIGAVLIDGRDLVDEILEESWGDNTTLYLNGIALGCGKVTGDLGWGYSEYTPMDSDELSFGGVDVLEALKAREGETVSIVVSDEEPTSQNGGEK